MLAFALLPKPRGAGGTAWGSPMVSRITGGTLRGRQLRSARAADLRPTPERVRLAVFSILGRERVEGARVLDLYAGAGTLGIEALSRGAEWADFVESGASRCRDLRQSLQGMGVAEKAHVHRGSVERRLHQLEGRYDLVFADPPYDLDPWESLMQQLGNAALMEANGTVVAEHRHNRSLAPLYGMLGLETRRRYGDTAISIYTAGTVDG